MKSESYLIQLYDVGVADLLEYLNLPGDPLDVLLVLDFLLLKDFYSDLDGINDERK